MLKILNPAYFDEKIFVELMYQLKQRDLNGFVELYNFMAPFYIHETNNHTLKNIVYCINWVFPHWHHVVKTTGRTETSFLSVLEVALNPENLNQFGQFEAVLNKMLSDIRLCGVNHFPEYQKYRSTILKGDSNV